MIKKSFFALLLVMLFAFSVCTSTFAAISFDGSAVPTIWDSVAGKRVDMPGITKLAQEMAGKTSDDEFYYLDSSCTNLSTGLYNLGAGNTLECQFMLKSDSSSLVLRANLYFANNKANGNDASDYNRLVVDSAGVRYYGGRWSSGTNTLKWDIPHEIVPGRWYTLVAEYEDKSASEGEQNGKFYINGKLLKEDTSLGTYGFRHFTMGAADGAHGVYLDNVVCSNVRGADSVETHVLDIEKSKVSYITDIAKGAVVSETLGDVMALPGMTVGDIKTGLTTTDGADDAVTVYNSDFTAAADDSEDAIGKVIAIASKNGTSQVQAYNYYDITELDLDKELGRGKCPDDLVLYNDKTTVTSVPGNFGKLASDDVYKVVSTSSEQIHLPKSLANGAGVFGDSGVLKFQFALEEGAFANIVLNGDADGYQYGKEMQINIYEGTVSTGTKGGATETVKNADVKNNEWYTAAITVPTAQNNNDNLIKVYINGKIVFTIYETEMKSLRRPTLNIYNGYFDNIEVYDGSSYNPADDTPAYLDVAKGAASLGKILYSQKPQSADDYILADAGTTLRFYDDSWNPADAANAKYVLTAGQNDNMVENIIEYYELAPSASDYVLEGYTNNETYKVKAYSKDRACVYVAEYDNGELASLRAVKLDNEWKEIPAGLSSKVMLWADDGSIMPLKPIAKFDLRK